MLRLLRLLACNRRNHVPPLPTQSFFSPSLSDCTVRFHGHDAGNIRTARTAGVSATTQIFSQRSFHNPRESLLYGESQDNKNNSHIIEAAHCLDIHERVSCDKAAQLLIRSYLVHYFVQLA